jgi:putative acetyltransferase
LYSIAGVKKCCHAPLVCCRAAWFDAAKCARGIDALKLYRADYDDKLQALRRGPSFGSIMNITLGDLADPRVVDLLEYHLTSARAHTAPGSAHALDIGGLQAPNMTFWTAWDCDTLVAIGALKRLAKDHGEVKSMHTAPSARRKGIGSAMLQHIVAFARSRGISRLSLETGSWDYFQPAIALYRKHGFVECQPFADYVQDPNSVFMTLDLGQLTQRDHGALGV